MSADESASKVSISNIGNDKELSIAEVLQLISKLEAENRGLVKNKQDKQEV